MATLEFIILVSVAVLLSSVIDQILPKISTPLIQIGLGVIIGLLAWSPIKIDISPDIFLLLFIAPLLYDEARRSDRTSLWRHHVSVLSLAIGLVVAIMLIVGFSLNALFPSIPLAAAFALGAALGPTDAVAVSSLKREVKLTRRENALLNGECLLNDASGIVTFQFAVAAVVTGFYSWQGAVIDFTIEFFGGIALGVVVALLLAFIQGKVRDLGLESLTFFSLLDLITPFLVYMISVEIHVSGILAVVACGLMVSSFSDRKIGPSISRLNIHQANVWKVVSFVLNGIVFVILGIELPLALSETWSEPYINNGVLVGLVLFITFTIVAARFLWLLLMERLHRHKLTGKRSPLTFKRVLSCVALTVGGPKGAVTLSIIFSIPYLAGDGSPFPERDLIIFLASGVILCTLLLANFVLPLVSPSPKKSEVSLEIDEKSKLRVTVLRNVIQRLSAEQTEANANATRTVIAMYNDRIQRLMAETSDWKEKEGAERQRKLRIEILKHQQRYIAYLLDQGRAEPTPAYRLARRLNLQEQILSNHTSKRWFLRRALRSVIVTARATAGVIRQALPGVDESEREGAIRKLRIVVERETIRYLDHRIASGVSVYPPEMLGEMVVFYTNSVNMLAHTQSQVIFLAETLDDTEEVMRRGYRLELEEIQDLYENDLISRGMMKRMREDVYLMQLDLENRL